MSIKEYTREQCHAAMAELASKYDLDKPVSRYTDEIDRVVNDLAELEQRLDYLQMLDNIHKANASRWGNLVEGTRE